MFTCMASSELNIGQEYVFAMRIMQLMNVQCFLRLSLHTRSDNAVKLPRDQQPSLQQRVVPRSWGSRDR